MNSNLDEALTLDPPGRIAVIGAGPIGLECALYGRYLGYDVIVIESDKIGGSLNAMTDQPLPMMPDRCLSSLALSAIDSQLESDAPRILPLTLQAWIEDGLCRIAHSDLLSDRLMMPYRCESIELVPIEADDLNTDDVDEDDEFDGDVPPDFELMLCDEAGVRTTEKVECVVLATGLKHEIELRFQTPTAYFFQLGGEFDGNLEQDLRRGWREIVEVFASLMGRADLDLYRPRRI